MKEEKSEIIKVKLEFTIPKKEYYGKWFNKKHTEFYLKANHNANNFKDIYDIIYKVV